MKHLRYEKEFTFMRLVFLFSFSTNLWGEESPFTTNWKLIGAEVTNDCEMVFLSVVFLPVLIVVGFNKGPL